MSEQSECVVIDLLTDTDDSNNDNSKSPTPAPTYRPTEFGGTSAPQASPTPNPSRSPSYIDPLVQLAMSPKYCNAGCNGHGTCEARTVVDNTPLHTNHICSMSDISCYVICVCDNGYSGSLCGLTTKDLNKRKAVRDNLVKHLYR
jgi:hypothetical protein